MRRTWCAGRCHIARVVLAVSAILVMGGCSPGAAPESAGSADARAATISLPAPAVDGDVSLERAIDTRRSVRRFASTPLSNAAIGQLLWAGQGITGSDGKRAAPSAGALYPLELYVVTAGGLMHYLPDGHRAEILGSADLRGAVRDAALGQEAIGDAPAVIVIAAVADRTRAKYGARTDTYVAIEAGHTAQNILLTAVAHDLAAVPIGAFDPEGVAAALTLPADHTVLYLIPVGFPARDGPVLPGN